MASSSEIFAAISNGTADQLTDWSSGGTPGAGISNEQNAGADSPLSSYETHLQSLEGSDTDTAKEASPSTQEEQQDGTEQTNSVQDLPVTEDLFVTLEDGRKAKITADYSDRNKIKKAYEMAAGMRKFAAERDKERARVKELDSQMQELKGTWSKLETAYQSGGVEGLIDLLEGKAGASKEYIAKRFEQERLKEAMPPAERARLEMEERLELDRRQRDANDRTRQQELDRVHARLAEADEKETRALVTPSFEKHRFKGKLGDPVAEHHFDQAVWMQALSNLEQLDEGDLTPDAIDREFSRVSSAFARVAKQQATKATKQAVDTKKQEAKTQAAVLAMQGMNTPGNKEKDLTKRLWSGDSVGVLKDLLSGRK
jgi:hypothetical protein